jgi:hypothetical protein
MAPQDPKVNLVTAAKKGQLGQRANRVTLVLPDSLDFRVNAVHLGDKARKVVRGEFFYSDIFNHHPKPRRDSNSGSTAPVSSVAGGDDTT